MSYSFYISDINIFQDWISITYLLFYMLVFTIVLSLLALIKTTPGTGAPAFSRPYSGVPVSYPANTRVVINQTFVPQSDLVVTTPTNYPGFHHPPPYNDQDTTAFVK